MSVAAPVYIVILVLSAVLYFYTMQAIRGPVQAGSEELLRGIGALAQYFWYCDRLQTSFRATSLIEHTPVDEYVTEVEEMVSSIKCP